MQYDITAALEICIRLYPDCSPYSWFTKLAEGLICFVLISNCSCTLYITTYHWAVETFCTSKQMSLWTKCFHIPVQVVHSFAVVFDHPLKVVGFHNLLHGNHSVQLFILMPSISLRWPLSVLYVAVFY